jgi:hypothetical protein
MEVEALSHIQLICPVECQCDIKIFTEHLFSYITSDVDEHYQ